MTNAEVEALQSRANAADDIDEDLVRLAAVVLRGVFPGAPKSPERQQEPTEATLHLIDQCLPGWTITLSGVAAEPDGHWHCSLRESDGSDDDSVIGSAEAPTVGLALLRALLAVARFESVP